MSTSPLRVKIKGFDETLLFHENFSKLIQNDFIYYNKLKIDIIEYIILYNQNIIKYLSKNLGIPINSPIGFMISILFLLKKNKFTQILKPEYITQSKDFFKKNHSNEIDIIKLYCNDFHLYIPDNDIYNIDINDIDFFENIFLNMNPKKIIKIIKYLENLCYKNKILSKSPYHYAFYIYKNNREFFSILYNMNDQNIDEISNIFYFIDIKSKDKFLNSLNKLYIKDYPRKMKDKKQIKYEIIVKPISEVFNEHLNSKSNQLFIYDYEDVLNTHSLYYNDHFLSKKKIYYHSSFNIFIKATNINMPIIFIEEKEDNISFVNELFNKFGIKCKLQDTKCNREIFIKKLIKSSNNINNIIYTSGNPEYIDQFKKYYIKNNQIKNLKLNLISIEDEIIRNLIKDKV